MLSANPVLRTIVRFMLAVLIVIPALVIAVHGALRFAKANPRLAQQAGVKRLVIEDNFPAQGPEYPST